MTFVVAATVRWKTGLTQRDQIPSLRFGTSAVCQCSVDWLPAAKMIHIKHRCSAMDTVRTFQLSVGIYDGLKKRYNRKRSSCIADRVWKTDRPTGEMKLKITVFTKTSAERKITKEDMKDEYVEHDGDQGRVKKDRWRRCADGSAAGNKEVGDDRLDAGEISTVKPRAAGVITSCRWKLLAHLSTGFGCFSVCVQSQFMCLHFCLG